MLLDKVVKEKNEFRDLNSHPINDLRASMCVLKETLISCSHKTELAENQTQNLMLRLAKLQCKLNSQPYGVSAIKVKALIGKKWNASWDRNLREDTVKLGMYTEPLHSDESSCQWKRSPHPQRQHSHPPGGTDLTTHSGIGLSISVWTGKALFPYSMCECYLSSISLCPPCETHPYKHRT